MASALWARTVVKEGGQGERGASTYHSEYIVKMNSPTALRNEVLHCGLLPVYGSPNAEDPSAICCKTDARRVAGHPSLWRAMADWNASPTSGRDPADDQKQPDERRPKWRARFVPFPLARFVDLSTPRGKLLCDTAGTPFDPVPDIPIICDEVTIFRYEATCDRAAQSAYMNKSNADSFLDADPGTVIFDDIEVEDEYIQGSWWFGTTYRVLYKPRIDVVLPPLGETATIGGFDPESILNVGPLAWRFAKQSEITAAQKAHDANNSIPMLQKNADGKYVVKAPPTHGHPDPDFADGRPAFLDEFGVEISIDPTTGALQKSPIFLNLCSHPRKAFAPLALTPPPGWSGI